MSTPSDPGGTSNKPEATFPQFLHRRTEPPATEPAGVDLSPTAPNEASTDTSTEASTETSTEASTETSNGGLKGTSDDEPPNDAPKSDDEGELKGESEDGQQNHRDPHEADLAKIRGEFEALCTIKDPLAQSYQLIRWADASNLPADEYRALFETYRKAFVHPTPENQEQLLRELDEEFRKIAAIRDPVERNYQLIQKAKASEIDTQEYRQLFHEFERREATGARAIAMRVWRGLRTSAAVLGSLTIFWGIVLFILEADSRKQDAHTQAWQVITSGKTSSESAGRIQALNTLTKGCSYRDVNRPTLDRAQPPDSNSSSDLGSWLDGSFNPVHRLFQTLNPARVAWRETAIIGGFIPDCVSLRGLDISGAHLPEVELNWAELKNARMQHSKLWSASLQGAQLQGALLKQARLRDADLKGANFAGAQLRHVDLAGADLRCWPRPAGEDSAQRCHQMASLERADLTGANLRGGNRDNGEAETQLGSANLAGAIFDRALYDRGTTLEVCDVTELNAEDWCDAPETMSIQEFLELPSYVGWACAAAVPCWDIRKALEDAYRIGRGTVLRSSATLDLAELSNADLRRATLRGVAMKGVNLRSAQLTEAVLTSADLTCAPITNSGVGDPFEPSTQRCADLRDTDLRGARLQQALLSGAALVNANLSCYDDPLDETLQAAAPICTDLSRADLSNANLSDADISGARLEGANLTNANLRGVTGLTVEQIQSAQNWRQAVYDEEVRSQLGL